MTVVAEGVETLAQYNEVVASGCEAAQGFLFARPISIDELDIELSRSWR